MSEMTINGISVCLRGEERYEYFTPAYAWRTGKQYCQYDYRTEDGELFSCVAPTLEECRRRRDQWLNKKTDK